MLHATRPPRSPRFPRPPQPASVRRALERFPAASLALAATVALALPAAAVPPTRLAAHGPTAFRATSAASAAAAPDAGLRLAEAEARATDVARGLATDLDHRLDGLVDLLHAIPAPDPASRSARPRVLRLGGAAGQLPLLRLRQADLPPSWPHAPGQGGGLLLVQAGQRVVLVAERPDPTRPEPDEGLWAVRVPFARLTDDLARRLVGTPAWPGAWRLELGAQGAPPAPGTFAAERQALAHADAGEAGSTRTDRSSLVYAPSGWGIGVVLRLDRGAAERGAFAALAFPGAATPTPPARPATPRPAAKPTAIPTAPVATAAVPVPETRAPGWRWAADRGMLAAAGAIGGLVLLVLGVVGWRRARRRPAEDETDAFLYLHARETRAEGSRASEQGLQLRDALQGVRRALDRTGEAAAQARELARAHQRQWSALAEALGEDSDALLDRVGSQLDASRQATERARAERVAPVVASLQAQGTDLAYLAVDLAVEAARLGGNRALADVAERLKATSQALREQATGVAGAAAGDPGEAGLPEAVRELADRLTRGRSVARSAGSRLDAVLGDLATALAGADHALGRSQEAFRQWQQDERRRLSGTSPEGPEGDEASPAKEG